MTKYKHYFCYPELNHSWELEFSFNKAHQLTNLSVLPGRLFS